MNYHTRNSLKVFHINKITTNQLLKPLKYNAFITTIPNGFNPKKAKKSKDGSYQKIRYLEFNEAVYLPWPIII